MIRFLEKCAQVEHLVSEIYFEFSGSQENDEALTRIWKDMARDEENHCQQLRLAARLPIRETFSGINPKCPKPEPLCEQASTILEKTKQNPFSMLDMLRTAVVLEKEFRKLHTAAALEFSDADLRKTFDRLSRADSEHLRELDAYLKEYKEKQKAGEK